MKTIFITGATGFIGSHVVAELVRQGVHCKCLIRPTSETRLLESNQIELISGSLEQPESYRAALAGCDTVLHLAGMVHSIDRTQLFRINAEVTAELADACSSLSPAPRFIYLSSIAAAGPPPIGTTIRSESDAPQPISYYGQSKRKAEILLTDRAKQLPITIIRPGIVYGTGDKKYAEILRMIYRWRLHVVAGFRTPPLSLIYVEDLVKLLILAIEKGEVLTTDLNSSSGYYFACDDSEYPSYWVFGQRIAKSLDRYVFVWPLWRWVARTVGWTAENISKMLGRASVLTLDKVREGTVRSWACSSQKAQQSLGFQVESKLDDNLRQTSQWYIENGWV
jgi:dihydroflavonol-4-reductase